MFDDEDQALAPGDRLGRFEITRHLGHGGMGMVFLARDTLLDTQVALKVLAPELATSEGLERFRREALLARQVTHPGICRIYDLHHEQGKLCISMEYVEGPTLLKVLRSTGMLPLDIAVELIRAICQAVSSAHDLDIVHRDLKPANIIVRGRARISILDFGLSMAASMARITQAGQAMGTVHYMPPEVICGETSTKQSDIYTTGVILYECLTGRLPFEGEHFLALQQAIVGGQVTPASRYNPRITPELETIIRSAIAVRPEQRFPSMATFERALTDAEAAAMEQGGFEAYLVSSKVSGFFAPRGDSLDAVDHTEAYDTLSSDAPTAMHESAPGPAAHNAATAAHESAPSSLPPELPTAAEDLFEAPAASPPQRGRRRGLLAAILILAAAAIAASLWLGGGDLLRTGGTGSSAMPTDASLGATADSAPALALAQGPLDAAVGLVDQAAGQDLASAEPGPDPEQGPVKDPVTNLRSLQAEIKKLKRGKGIVKGDSRAFDRTYRKMIRAQRRNDLDAAQREGQAAITALRRVRIDAAFVNRKINKFNLLLDRRGELVDEAKAIQHSNRIIEAFERGDHAKANILLNEGFRSFRK